MIILEYILGALAALSVLLVFYIYVLLFLIVGKEIVHDVCGMWRMIKRTELL